MIKINSSK